MNLNKARRIVADYIRPWTTQKLCEVLAFCEDGRMDLFKPCCCLVGVGSSDLLHSECSRQHYTKAKRDIPNSKEAELAYAHLAWSQAIMDKQSIRDRELAAIIRAELAVRERVAEQAFWGTGGGNPESAGPPSGGLSSSSPGPAERRG